jgi:alpha-D-xyloside xylohydrolase
LFSDNWDANTKAILLNFDKLRYRLLPYIYSLAGKVTTENYTMMRALTFDFRNDEKVYSIPDQYMFGPAFMVNPVTEQLYTSADADKKAKARQVYLPAATKWYNFWTGEVLDGGQTVSAAAPIEILPLYVKAGSIIPMGPHVEYATEKPANNIELRIYPGADGTFKLYEDENENYNYEKGAFATTNFIWNDKAHKLTISDTKGHFKGMLKSRTFNIVLVKGAHGSDVEVTAKADKVVKYAGKAMVVNM